MSESSIVDRHHGKECPCEDAIVGDLWTPGKFLSWQPITNVLGSIAVPGQPIGVNVPAGINSQLDATATPSPIATLTLGEARQIYRCALAVSILTDGTDAFTVEDRPDRDPGRAG